jgi:suppressor of ftsI
MRTVNAAVNPSIRIDAGETQLWRMANLSADIYYELQLAGHQLHIIAEDGNPVWQVNGGDSLPIAPGKRFDVLVQGGEPGTVEFKTLQYDQQGDLYPETLLATVTVNPSGLTAAALPVKLVEPNDLNEGKVDVSRTITFAKDQATGHFMIDGKVFDENRIDQAVKLGALEEWTIINDNNQQHPFHIHTNDFQVISINDEPYQASSHVDTINLPTEGKVTVRIPFLDFTGKFVYHCHILNHADMGMMGTVEVTE